MWMLAANHWTEHRDPNGGVRERTEGAEVVCMAPAVYITQDVLICIHSFVEGHLGCFQLLTIINKAAMNIVGHVF